MSSVVENDPKNAKPPKKEGFKITGQTIVIALLALGATILLAYQMFGCDGCYL